MKIGIALVKQLRSMDYPENQARELRAIFVAQAIAYHVPLSGVLALEEQVTQHEPLFIRTLNEVNEFVPVDTKLCKALFNRLLKGRIELVQGVTDPFLVIHAMTSDTQLGAISQDLQDAVKTFCGHYTFTKGQLAVSEVIQQAMSEPAN